MSLKQAETPFKPSKSSFQQTNLESEEIPIESDERKDILMSKSRSFLCVVSQKTEIIFNILSQEKDLFR